MAQCAGLARDRRGGVRRRQRAHLSLRCPIRVSRSVSRGSSLASHPRPHTQSPQPTRPASPPPAGLGEPTTTGGATRRRASPPVRRRSTATGSGRSADGGRPYVIGPPVGPPVRRRGRWPPRGAPTIRQVVSVGGPGTPRSGRPFSASRRRGLSALDRDLSSSQRPGCRIRRVRAWPRAVAELGVLAVLPPASPRHASDALRRGAVPICGDEPGRARPSRSGVVRGLLWLRPWPSRFRGVGRSSWPGLPRVVRRPRDRGSLRARRRRLTAPALLNDSGTWFPASRVV